MTYLAIDLGRVGAFTAALRSGANLVDDAEYYLGQGELLADLPVLCAPALHDIAHDFGLMADRVDWAADRIRSLRLSFAASLDWRSIPQPVRTPVPESATPSVPGTMALVTAAEARPVQWDAEPAHQWNQVHQVSSHNSYELRGGVQVLFDQGVRSFELDVHRRVPAELLSPLATGFGSPWVHVAGDGDDQDGPQWHVYHTTGLSFSEYDALGEGLAAIVALNTLDPLTLFIDVKDGFGGAHTVEAFDRLLIDEIGPRLYTPATFQTRGDESATLLDSAQSAGWPEVEDLQGRIIVVLTDEIGAYARPEAQAFVAPPPQFDETGLGHVQHVPQPDAIFYNASARSIGSEEIAAVHRTNTMLRTYFNSRCGTSLFDQIGASVHYRAVDIAANGPLCGPSNLVPPTDVPVPANQVAEDG